MEYWLDFVLLGVFFLAGLAADTVGRRTRLPRVTLLMACGLLMGRSGFGLIPEHVEAWFEFLSIAALTMVAFLLGSSLTWSNMVRQGRAILWVSLSIVVVTVAAVTVGLVLMGVDPAVALVLGTVAAATDPAATSDALRQAGINNSFADSLRGIVAIDDAWGLMLFSLVMVAVHAMNGGAELSFLVTGLWEIFGAFALAAVIGFPAAYLTGRIRHGEPLEAEAIGIVFLSAGLALWLEVSFLIVGMTIGVIIVNFAPHHQRAFHEIDRIQWPFMILFFILAGASFDLDALIGLGALGIAYMGLRVLSRIAGGWIGAQVGRAPRAQRPWFGAALLPQAGVAIGMALVAAETMPQHAATILTLTIGATIVFELVGPLATVFAARRVAALERRSAD